MLATLDRGWVGAGGIATAELESALAAAFGRPAAIAVSSGSAALEIALRVAGVSGVPVAIPAFACGSIERAVRRAGCHPLLVDADPADLSLPPGSFRSLAGQCEATVLVHQFGLPASSATEAAGAGLTVIEDVTTCVGGELGGRAVGTFGRLAVMSFSATKMLCAGEGGAILGSAKDIAAARRWIDPESGLPVDAPVPHAKLADIASALARAQLARLPEFVTRRSEIAELYDEALGVQARQVLRPPAGRTGTWWRYLVAVTGSARTAVEHGRASGVWFCRPVTERRWAGRGDFPVSERLHRTLISVPIYPALSDAEVRHVQMALRKAVAG